MTLTILFRREMWRTSGLPGFLGKGQTFSERFHKERSEFGVKTSPVSVGHRVGTWTLTCFERFRDGAAVEN